MRLLALAVVGFVLASATVARAEEDGPLERAARMEKEAQGLLEHGHRAEGARLMAKAWALRAEAWGGAARSPHEKAGEPRGDDPYLDAMRRGAELERQRREAEAAKHAQEEARRAERAAGPEDVRRLAEWRMRVAELKARSEALEREGKAAKAAGDEAAAKEKMAASGRAWKEAEALEREGRDRHDVPAFSELRLRRAEAQARIEELETALHRIEGGLAEGGEARKEEIRAKVAALRAQVAALDREAKGMAGRRGPDRERPSSPGLADQVERLRGEVRELREALQALQRALKERAESR